MNDVQATQRKAIRRYDIIPHNTMWREMTLYYNHIPRSYGSEVGRKLVKEKIVSDIRAVSRSRLVDARTKNTVHNSSNSIYYVSGANDINGHRKGEEHNEKKINSYRYTSLYYIVILL